MACEICGRGNCTSMFHSLEEQQIFEDTTSAFKETLLNKIEARVNKLRGEHIDDNYYILLDDVLQIISDNR